MDEGEFDEEILGLLNQLLEAERRLLATIIESERTLGDHPKDEQLAIVDAARVKTEEAGRLRHMVEIEMKSIEGLPKREQVERLRALVRKTTSSGS